MPFIILPLVINAVVDLIVVNKRLTRYFNAPERPVQALPADIDAYEPLSRGLGDGASDTTSPLSYGGYFLSPTAPDAGSGVPALEMRGATFKYPGVKKEESDTPRPPPKAARGARSGAPTPLADDDAAATDEVTTDLPTLSNIELRIPQGTLVGVAGSVGSGKSTLLMAALGDIPRQSGRVVVRGSVALCLQEPWIQTATLKANVLFGAPYDAARYTRVLDACALLPDIEMLPNGDATEIGERGVNLSGGQKARIALARACYADASLYLLDDVLAAVDQHTGRHLMHKAIMGLLKERGATVVLCTHHTQWLPSCDHVILLDNGKITDQGPPGSVTLPAAESAAAPTDAPAAPPPAAAAAAGPTPAAAPAAAEDDDSEFAGDGSASDGAGKIIEDEDRSKGYVAKRVWLTYFRTFGAGRLSLITILLTAERVIGYGGSSWWVSQWASQQPVFGQSSTAFYLTVSFVLLGGCSALNLSRNILMYLTCLRTARIIHTRAITAVCASPMSFFEKNPLGRLLNRFQSDQQKIDWQFAGVRALGDRSAEMAGSHATPPPH